MRKVLEVIWGVRKQKYFCKEGWTPLSTNRPSGKSPHGGEEQIALESRMEISPSFRGALLREPGIHNHDREYGFRACASTMRNWASGNETRVCGAPRSIRERLEFVGRNGKLRCRLSRRRRCNRSHQVDFLKPSTHFS